MAPLQFLIMPPSIFKNSKCENFTFDIHNFASFIFKLVLFWLMTCWILLFFKYSAIFGTKWTNSRDKNWLFEHYFMAHSQIWSEHPLLQLGGIRYLPSTPLHVPCDVSKVCDVMKRTPLCTVTCPAVWVSFVIPSALVDDDVQKSRNFPTFGWE